MFCPKCGKINPDTAEKCSGCEAVLHEEQVASPEKKKGKVLKTVIFGIIIIAIVVAAVVLLNGCSRQPTPQDSMTF